MIINNGNTPTEESQMLRYIRNLAKKDPKLARAQILHYISEHKDEVDAYYLYGKIEEQLGNLESAKDAFKIVASEPRGVNKYNAIVRIGIISNKLGNFEDAIKYLKTAIENSPKEEKTACIALATIYRKQKKYDEAIDLLRKIKIQTSDVIEEISIALSLKGEKRAALTELNRIKKGSSKIYNRHIALEKAKLATEIGEFTKAEYYLMEAKDTKTKDLLYYQALYQEAILAKSKEDYNLGTAICEELISVKETFNGNANITLGEIQEAIGNYVKAIENYKIAINTSTDDSIKSNGYFHLGVLEFALGDFANAERNLKASIINNEAVNKVKTIRLVSIYLRQGRYQEAQALISDFSQKIPTALNQTGLSIASIIISKRTNQPLPKRNSQNYLESQVIEYRADEAIRHIKHHHQNGTGTVSNFSKKINVDTLFDEIKLQMDPENMVYEDIFDIYEIDYPNAGYDLDNRIVNRIRVVTIPGTKDIITMYPSGKKGVKRIGDVKAQISDQRNRKNSQIEKFNARYAKFTNHN